MKLTKKVLAYVLTGAMVATSLTGYQAQTASAESSTLKWSNLYDSKGTASIIDNSDVLGTCSVEFDDYTTDYGWGGDSKWQGQAQVSDIAVESGKKYKASVEVSASSAKTVLIQTLTGSTYTENSASFDSNGGTLSVEFTADAATLQITLAFGAMTAEEAATYEYIAFEDLKIEEVTMSEEESSKQAELERVKAGFTSTDNLALNKTATSSSAAGDTTYLAGEAVDGNTGSRWAAKTYDAGEWIMVDLGDTYDITGVSYMWEGAYATKYIIQVSDDGTNFTDVKTVDATTNETVEFPVTATGRYVRTYCVSNALPYGYSIWEIGVFGTKASEETTEEVTTAEETTEEVTTAEETTEEVTTAEETSAEEVTSAQVVEGNLITNDMLATYLGSDWTWCYGTSATDNGTISFNMTRRGGGWTGAMWGTQGIIQDIPTAVGETYKYTGTITSDIDMTIYVKVTDSTDAEIVYEPITLKAGEAYNYETTFAATETKTKIIYALAAESDTDMEAAYNLTISNNVLVPSTEEVTTKEEVTSQEATSQEATSQEETSSTEEETSAAADEWTAAGANWNTYGDWQVYAGDWSTATAEYKTYADSNSIAVKRKSDAPSGAAWDMYAAQLKLELLTGITAGQSYTFTATLASDTTDGKVFFGDNTYDLSTEPQTITLTQEAGVVEGTDVVYLQFVLALGRVGMDNGVYVTNAVVTDANGNVVYPAPAQEETSSTEEVTTSQEKVTTAPATTTKATTFKKTETPKVVKATKKKAAKKLKITLAKKITGAKGYAVRVFTSAKTAKANKKAKAAYVVTVKKNVKTFTVKNWRLKNKKTLYVRVRAYAVVKGKKVYSNRWSAVKKAVVK